jgi:hypothetical protein
MSANRNRQSAKRQCVRHRMSDGTIMNGPTHGPGQTCIEWSDNNMSNSAYRTNVVDPRMLPENSKIDQINKFGDRSRLRMRNTECPAGQKMIDGVCQVTAYKKYQVDNSQTHTSWPNQINDASTRHQVRSTSVRDFNCPSGWKVLDKISMTYKCETDENVYVGNDNPVKPNSQKSNMKSTSQIVKLANTSGYHKK